MVLEALKRPFRKTPKEDKQEQPELKPLEAANEGLTKTLQVLETLNWQPVYALMERWNNVIQILYDECPPLPAGKELETLIKHAEQQPHVQEAKKELGIEGEIAVHPSWLRHGYVVDVDWKNVDLPEVVKRFLHPKKSSESTVQIGTHVMDLPAEFLDSKTQSIFSLWSGDRGVELLVSTDFWAESVAGQPHTDYVSRLRFLKPSKEDPKKLELENPNNFDQFGEAEMPLGKVLLVTKMLQFATAKSSVQQEVQDVRAWE